MRVISGFGSLRMTGLGRMLGKYDERKVWALSAGKYLREEDDELTKELIDGLTECEAMKPVPTGGHSPPVYVGRGTDPVRFALWLLRLLINALRGRRGVCR